MNISRDYLPGIQQKEKSVELIASKKKWWEHLKERFIVLKYPLSTKVIQATEVDKQNNMKGKNKEL